jgi:nucleoside 2-deoxyribosyltransferase
MGTLEDKPMKVYTAGPLGFSEAGKMAHAHIVKMLQDLGHEILDPWTYDPAAIGQVLAMPYGAERKAAWERLNPLIGKANQQLIDQSNLIFAVLDGVDVDSGTAAEIGYGFAKGKKIIGYRGDFRLSADNEGSIVNLQVEYFIEASGGTIVTRLADVASALAT